jgi:hypothetical protein
MDEGDERHILWPHFARLPHGFGLVGRFASTGIRRGRFLSRAFGRLSWTLSGLLCNLSLNAQPERAHGFRGTRGEIRNGHGIAAGINCLP